MVGNKGQFLTLDVNPIIPPFTGETPVIHMGKMPMLLQPALDRFELVVRDLYAQLLSDFDVFPSQLILFQLIVPHSQPIMRITDSRIQLHRL